MTRDELVRDLREPIWTEAVMKRWDVVRQKIARGHQGSEPRDIIESDLDDWDDQRRAAADRIEADGKLIAEMRALVFKAAHFNGHAQVEQEASAILARLDAEAQR
jgi:hypothetical protein